MDTPLQIGSLQLYQVAEVAAIERLCFSEPWSEDGIYRFNAADCGQIIVGLLNDKVVAYAGLMTVLDEGYIANIATHPDYRRRGLGRQVVRHLARMGRDMHLAFITLEVRASNAPAIALYEAEGFTCEGTRPGYYDLPKEDALIMTLRLTEKPQG